MSQRFSLRNHPIEQIGKTLRGAMGAMKSISVGVERVVELEEA